MKLSQKISRLGLFVFFLCFVIQSTASAAALEVSMRLYQAGRWRVPELKKIVITHRPQPFQVVIKNNSKSSVSIYTKAAGRYSDSIFLEVKLPSGKTQRISRRPQASDSSTEVSQYMNPGEEIEVDILLDPEEWTVSEAPVEKGPYKVRAAYYNGFETIRSEEYEVFFNIL